jgi:hypothetical protein
MMSRPRRRNQAITDALSPVTSDMSGAGMRFFGLEVAAIAKVAFTSEDRVRALMPAVRSARVEPTA